MISGAIIVSHSVDIPPWPRMHKILVSTVCAKKIIWIPWTVSDNELGNGLEGKALNGYSSFRRSPVSGLAT